MSHRASHSGSDAKDDGIDSRVFTRGPKNFVHEPFDSSSSFENEIPDDEHEEIEIASFRDGSSIHTNHVGQHKRDLSLNFKVKSKPDTTFYRRLTASLKKNKRKAALFVVTNILLYTALGLVASRRIDRNQVRPFYINPDSIDSTILSIFKEELKEFYDQHSLDSRVLDDAGDNASKFAMHWMASDPNNNLRVEQNEKVKRFVLACFYYSTNMVPSPYVIEPPHWRSAINWLTPKPTCEWEGIDCNDDLEIISISMDQNRLSGVLPLELSIIAKNLDTLELTSNHIYMEGDAFDVFESLVNLEYLHMNDNYLVYDRGLPLQLAAMSNLKAIRLSYNIMGGQLEGTYPVLEGLNQLTHLELESNHFNGTFPAIIGNMDNLIYVYMRQNSMRFNLDFIEGGKLTNLSALWLESDRLSGTIPSDIGLLTNLVSLSLSDSSLTGTIPQELGNLTDLQRLWLSGNGLEGQIPSSLNNLSLLEVAEFHNNYFSGAMPSGVCDAIASNDYELKSLTSDCLDSQVQCDSPFCCTKCFR